MKSDCRVNDCGGECSGGENSIAGDFFDNCAFNPKKLCCLIGSPYTENTCHWQGQDGSCYDNVCAFNTEIQLTQSYDSGGANCGYRLERAWVFCCETPGGVQPFLPVPLEYSEFYENSMRLLRKVTNPEL